MHRSVLALAVLLFSAATLPAAADCRSEVEAAFEKQRTTAPGYRVQTEQHQQNGVVEITIDYMQPDRMYQKVVAPNERAPIETIAVGRWAWGNMGGGWEELQPQFAQSVTSFTQATLTEPARATGDFECLGKAKIDGRDLVGYRSKPSPTPPDRGVGASESNTVVQRTLYVDAETGLPAINIIAEAGQAAKPWVRTTYAYPKDIAVEAPVGAAPAPRVR
jgi:hypothetical protein